MDVEIPPSRSQTSPEQPTGRRGGALGAGLVVICAALLVSVWGVTLVGRTVRSPPAILALAVTLLPYLYALSTVFTFGVWCVVPDRRVLPALLIGLVGSGALLWAPSWPARGEVVEGTPLRVMTWNVRRLWGGPGDGGDPTRCVAETIRAQDPDALTLLEVTEEDLERLSAELGLACVHTDYLATGDVRRGGLAACARGDRWRLVGGDAWPFVDRDDWHYVLAELGDGTRVVNLLAVHLHPYHPMMRRQVREGVRHLAQGVAEPLLDVGRSGEGVIRAQGDQSVALLERIGRFVDPSIVAGDFNSTRDAALHTTLRHRLVDTWERGGYGFGATSRIFGRLPLRIDYIYAGARFAVQSSWIPAEGCSDHRPVVSQLVLPTKR